jgi:uncharacterized membrane protein
MLLLCYFLPSLLTAFRLVDPGQSKLYFVASRYLLPASLVLLTISIDLREILRLGPKALIMFLTGTVGVVIGGPIAILIVSRFSPELVSGEGADEVWRGMSMVAEAWMLFLLLGVGKAKEIDALFKADASSIATLQQKMEDFSLRTAKIPTTTDYMVLLAIAFGCTGACHLLADRLAPMIGQHYPALSKFSLDSEFFWLIVLATTFGLTASFTRLRELEGVGASKIGTLFIFMLVATIGLNMDIRAVNTHRNLFLVGGIWMSIHVGLMFFVGWLIKAPYFFLAVGSKANIGGAASAPVVAAAFHPSLAPVGVLLAVLGYALGTYAAWLCGLMMQYVAP